MHAWNDERGHYIAQKMRQLYGRGCDVKLQYGFAGESVRNTFAARTGRGFMPVHTTGKDTNEDGLIDLYVCGEYATKVILSARVVCRVSSASVR